ncbi:MAG: ExbD/TolR family protein [Oligosphaeraceae bacterium]
MRQRLESHPLQEAEEEVQVNISPLVDMVFLLLIFFMVTSVFTRQGALPVTLPQSASSREPAADTALCVALTPEGGLLLEGEPISWEELRPRVEEALARRKRPVLLLADQGSPTGKTVEALEQCRLAGATHLSLGTQTPISSTSGF